MSLNDGLCSGDNRKVKRNSSGEDPRLKNWTSWMKERQNVSLAVVKKVKRKPEESVMNAAEEKRDVLEDKSILDYMKIPTHFDKYRGNPAYWKAPVALKDKCNRHVDSNYRVVQTKPEKNIIPQMEFVGVPRVIQDEKHILPRTRNMYKLWQNIEYRKKRMEKYASTVNMIKPHNPDFEDLVIVGKKIVREDIEAKEKEKSVEGDADLNIYELNNCDREIVDKYSRLELEINGMLLNELSCQDGGYRKLRLIFDYDISSASIISQCLIFENKGSTTLRINWNKMEKFKLFRHYIDEKWDKHGFYFDKNELLVLPKRKIEFPIKFKTENPGIYCECWKITTKPKMWNEDFQVIVVLQSNAYFQNLKEKINTTLNFIELKSKHTLIKEILADVLQQIKYSRVSASSCEYEEAQVFELANLLKGHPQYLFDKIVVDQLKAFYDKVKQEKHPKIWDYSIKNLKEIARVKDVTTYIENKKANISSKREKVNEVKSKTAIKEEVSKKAKPAKNKKGKKEIEIEDISKSKDKLVCYEPEEYIYCNQLEFYDILRKLETPALRNFDREKYFACFKVFSSYFIKMSQMLDCLEAELGINRTTHYPQCMNKITPVSQQPERLVYEYFGDRYRQKPVTPDTTYRLVAKPKAKILMDIDPDDIETIYRIYFNKSTAPAKSKSDVKQTKSGKVKSSEGSSKSKSGSKSKKADSKSKIKSKEKIIEPQREKSVELFNPYAEEFRYVETLDDENDSAELQHSDASEEVSDDYECGLYLIVYSCLADAVEAVVDVVNSFNCIVSYDTIMEVRKWFPNENNEETKK